VGLLLELVVARDVFILGRARIKGVSSGSSPNACGYEQNLDDAYSFVAIEHDRKLVLNIALGKRDQQNTNALVEESVTLPRIAIFK
jgi:hypothetical protein